MILFLFAFLGVFFLITHYTRKRLIAKLHLSASVKQKITLFLWLNFVGIFGYMLARYFTDTPNWLYFLVSLPIGVLFLFFCTALIYDLLRVTNDRLPMTEERRAFFRKGLDIGALSLAFGVSARAAYEARDVQLEKVEIALEKLKRSYTVVQLSDVHIGGLIDAAFIREVVTRVNALHPDVVVITGDLIDIEVSRASEPLAELQKLTSRYGTYFIPGNHEYFHGIDAILEGVEALGIHVLHNASVSIGEGEEGFTLAGVYDLFGYRAKHHLPLLSQALYRVDQNKPIVLLAHQPRYIEEADGKVDLMLSGHTHGGQLLPFKPLVKLQQPYISGLHRHSDRTQVYVNKGTGFWGPPMRLGASSEITHITLVPA